MSLLKIGQVIKKGRRGGEEHKKSAAGVVQKARKQYLEVKSGGINGNCLS